LPHAKNEGAWPGGKEIGSLPEQMPYPEWLHSDYVNRRQLQSCHMPEYTGKCLLPRACVPRERAASAYVCGWEFFHAAYAESVSHRLECDALPTEMTWAAERTLRFCKSQTARVSIPSIDLVADRLQVAGAGGEFDWAQDADGVPFASCMAAVTVRDTT